MNINDDSKKVYLIRKMGKENRKKNKYFNISEIRISVETLFAKLALLHIINFDYGDSFDVLFCS